MKTPERLNASRAEVATLRAACTLALRVMEQKNKVNVPPLAKFIEVKFAPEDVAVLREALDPPVDAYLVARDAADAAAARAFVAAYLNALDAARAYAAAKSAAKLEPK